MERLFRWIERHPWPILGITVFLTLLFLWKLRDVRFDDDITKYLPEDDPEISFYNSLEEKFSGFQKKSVIVALEFDDLFTPENLLLLQRVAESIKSLPAVQGVTALTNMPEIVATEYGVEVREIVEALPTSIEEARDLRERLKANDLVWGKIITPDGKGTVIFVSFFDTADQSKAIHDVERVVREMVPQGVQVTLFGARIIVDEMSKDAQRNMRFLTPVAGGVLLVILFWGFRNIRGMILPIVIALLAAVWTIGVAMFLGKSFTVISASLPVLLLSLVSAYGVHFINRYHEEYALAGNTQAVTRTLRGVFLPILMSALTTMGGFLSLLSAAIRPVSDFGLYAALGVLFGMVLATFSLGALYAAFPVRQNTPNKNPQGKQRDYFHRFLLFLSHSLLHRKRTVLVFLVVVTLLLCAGIPRIRVETTIRMQMGEEHPITKLVEYFKNRFGSTDYNYLCVTTENLKDPFVLREMVRITQYLKRFHNFQDPSSLASFLLDLNEAMEGWRAIPDEEEKIQNLWFFVKDSEYLQGRISEDERETIIEFRAGETTSAELKKELEEAREFLANRPKRVKKVPLDSAPARDALVKMIVDDLILFGVSLPPNTVQEIVSEFLGKPWQDFVTQDPSFLAKVTRDAQLEIEDLGLDMEVVQETLARALARGISFGEALEEDFGLDSESASYLGEVLAISLERVAKREKVEALRSKLEKLQGKELGKECDFALYEILDEVAYVEDKEGDITVAYRITGTPIISNRVNEMLFSQQAKSMILAFAIVFGLLLLQLASLRRASIAMVPILLTVATSFGIMGWFEIPLNVATLMVASIAIGAGIDYAIHFSARWYKEIATNSGSQALRATLLNTGRGILLNALGVAGGSYVMALSRIHMLRIFGSLVATVLLLGVFYTFIALSLLLHLEEYLGNENLKKREVSSL
ncbi:MAG: MMPL family transporter [Atribacterota bacterium]